MKNEINKALHEERIRVLKELLSLGVEFSDEILEDISGLTGEQIGEIIEDKNKK